tara:strand:- start:741 stop:1190 length:450 start_codon:yes stop_codon:yes gene_type:complete
MNYINESKYDIIIGTDKDNYDEINNKLNFRLSNIQKYIGLNNYNIDYSSSYIINKRGEKKQLNNILLKNNENVLINCIDNYIIICYKNDDNITVYKKENNIIKTYIMNILEIFKKNEFITCVLCLKDYDLYNLFRCKKRYHYFYEQYRT